MSTKPACQSFLTLLSPYIDGELPAPDRQVVERHLGACSDCTMRVADLRAESGLVRVGLEMAADEVDFKDFAQKVMARITPERPPLLERLRLSLVETFRYQRGMMVTSLVTAAVVLAVAVPLVLRTRIPEGYAGARMRVEEVTADPGAKVAPVVLETDQGNAIIWMVDQPAEAAEGERHEAAEELDVQNHGEGPPRPTGGEL